MEATRTGSHGFRQDHHYGANRFVKKHHLSALSLIGLSTLGKITAAQSANIFTNREYEMLLRSLNLRRLSYVLFTGERNQYLAQLPAIQEKLVDFLRGTAVAPVVVSEVSTTASACRAQLTPDRRSTYVSVSFSAASLRTT